VASETTREYSTQLTELEKSYFLTLGYPTIAFFDKKVPKLD